MLADVAEFEDDDAEDEDDDGDEAEAEDDEDVEEEHDKLDRFVVVLCVGTSFDWSSWSAIGRDTTELSKLVRVRLELVSEIVVVDEYC